MNLFVPQPVAEPERVAAYRQELEETEAKRYGVTLPEPDLDDADHWAEKVALLLEEPVPVVSFTFGLPDAPTVARFRDQGTYTIGTVTNVGEAWQAVNVGVAALCVQGPEAGGHRGVFDPAAEPSTAPLLTLLTEIRAEVGSSVPLTAAGALATPADVARARGAGRRPDPARHRLPARRRGRHTAAAPRGADRPEVRRDGPHPRLLRPMGQGPA